MLGLDLPVGTELLRKNLHFRGSFGQSFVPSALADVKIADRGRSACGFPRGFSGQGKYGVSGMTDRLHHQFSRLFRRDADARHSTLPTGYANWDDYGHEG